MADNIEITQDQNNFNKHSQFGMSLLEKSMRKFGFVEAGVLSEDNVICGGNARNEVAEDIGITKKRIIDIDGNEQVYLRRKGLKSGTEEFHELALALNAVPKANIVLAEEVLAETLTAEVCEAWGVKPETNYSLKNKEIDTDFDGQKYFFKLEYSEEEYTELKSKVEKLGKTAEAIFYDALISL